MLNIKWIRENPKLLDEEMARRGVAPVSQIILELDNENRFDTANLQNLQQKSNELAKTIGSLMAQGKKEEAQAIINESKKVKAKIASLKKEKNNAESNAELVIEEEKTNFSPLEIKLLELPNTLDSDIPSGDNEEDNIEIRKCGKIPTFDFDPKAHYEIGENLESDFIGSQIDFEQAAKMSGSRFAILKKDIAKLERALSNFMIDIHTEKFGYEEVSPPLLVNHAAMYGTSQLPKFAEDAFQTTDGRWLISTSEIVLANMVRENILQAEKLPFRFVAHTPCFRSEAGSAGKDTRGLIRMHQFYKVEMITICTEDDSKEELERKTSCAEYILQQLELPYRVMLLCSGDTGFGSKKTYDLEVWLPAQNKYREISSCSNCGDFQARRMNSRYRYKNEKNTKFVHTLNGSGLAIGRTIVAILENYQNKDGSVNIPDVLIHYMNGQKIIQNING